MSDQAKKITALIIAECARDETAECADCFRYRAPEIQAIVERAIAEEREACARIVDPKPGSQVYIITATRQGIAAAIRARGEQP